MEIFTKGTAVGIYAVCLIVPSVLQTIAIPGDRWVIDKDCNDGDKCSYSLKDRSLGIYIMQLFALVLMIVTVIGLGVLAGFDRKRLVTKREHTDRIVGGLALLYLLSGVLVVIGCAVIDFKTDDTDQTSTSFYVSLSAGIINLVMASLSACLYCCCFTRIITVEPESQSIIG